MQRHIIRCLISTILISLLIGCSSTPVKQVSLQAGLPVSELIAAYGKPYATSEGLEFHTYEWRLSEARLSSKPSYRSSRAVVSSTGVVSYSDANMPQVVTIRCQLTVRITLDHRVHDWQAEGRGCRQILYHQI